MKSTADKPLHCLIAEPDPYIAKLLLRFAEGIGLVCERAKSGIEVLALAGQSNPDIIIIDTEFPGDMMGLEVLCALKTDKKTQNIALISCSWLSEPEVRNLVGSLTGYLQKPDISLTDFEEAIRVAVKSLTQTNPRIKT